MRTSIKSTPIPRGGAVDGSRVCDSRPVSRTIKRAHLHRALHAEAERRGVRIEFAKRLAAAESLPDGVRVMFEDGSQASGDLLVGCDGVHSQTRRIIDA